MTLLAEEGSVEGGFVGGWRFPRHLSWCHFDPRGSTGYDWAMQRSCLQESAADAVGVVTVDSEVGAVVAGLHVGAGVGCLGWPGRHRQRACSNS